MGQSSQQEVETVMKSSTKMVYHESDSGQLIPRHIFVDFQPNFGNFKGCFYQNNGNQDQQANIVHELSDIWQV